MKIKGIGCNPWTSNKTWNDTGRTAVVSNIPCIKETNVDNVIFSITKKAIPNHELHQEEKQLRTVSSYQLSMFKQIFCCWIVML